MNSALLFITLRKQAEILRKIKLRYFESSRIHTLPSLPADISRKKIVIVGAGLAGLSAGLLLSLAGHEITILEARSRPGGRVKTLREEFAESMYAEAGAGRIADTHFWTLYWIKKFGLDLIPMYPRTGKYTHGDRTRAWLGADARFLSSYDSHHIIMNHHPWDMLTRSKSPLRDNIEHTLFLPSWFRIKGGMDLLPRAFANALQGCIHYGSAASTLIHDDRSVKVQCRDSASQKQIEADYVITTAPLSAQKQIDVIPALPADKTKVINECGQVAAVRLIFQLKDHSWLNQGRNGFGVTTEGIEIWRPSTDIYSRKSLVSFYAKEEVAEHYQQFNTSERAQAAKKILEQFFPRMRHLFESQVECCWHEEPWSWGAQSLIDRLPQEAMSTMKRSEGRLHFAGEHTTEGWMDGALASGYRVAREISDKIADSAEGVS